MMELKYLMDKNEIAALGASLRAIDQRVLKSGNGAGMTRMWFQGKEPYFDVFFELKNNEIYWFQFTLRGKSLSWDRNKPGWQTGNTNEMKIDDLNYYPASKTIHTDNKPDRDFLNLVQLILKTRSEETVFAKAVALFN